MDGAEQEFAVTNKSKASPPTLTRVEVEADMEQLLAERFCPPEWAFLPQVSNGTGYTHQRTADAVAMNCYPSRGLEVHGFEIKVSRQDWLRELRDPNKSIAVQQYCNRWWVVVSSRVIIEDGELPSTWGLMAPFRKGLKVYKQAPELETKPLSKTFVASVLRKATMCIAPQSKIDAAFALGRKDGLTEAHGIAERETTRVRGDLVAVQEAVTEFEAASGVKISRWSGGRIGEAVQTIMQCGKNPLVALRRQRDIMNRLVESLDGTIGNLEKDGVVNE